MTLRGEEKAAIHHGQVRGLRSAGCKSRPRSPRRKIASARHYRSANRARILSLFVTVSTRLVLARNSARCLRARSASLPAQRSLFFCPSLIVRLASRYLKRARHSVAIKYLHKQRYSDDRKQTANFTHVTGRAPIRTDVRD